MGEQLRSFFSALLYAARTVTAALPEDPSGGGAAQQPGVSLSAELSQECFEAMVYGCQGQGMAGGHFASENRACASGQGSCDV